MILGGFLCMNSYTQNQQAQAEIVDKKLSQFLWWSSIPGSNNENKYWVLKDLAKYDEYVDPISFYLLLVANDTTNKRLKAQVVETIFYMGATNTIPALLNSDDEILVKYCMLKLGKYNTESQEIRRILAQKILSKEEYGIEIYLLENMKSDESLGVLKALHTYLLITSSNSTAKIESIERAIQAKQEQNSKHEEENNEREEKEVPQSP